MGMPPGPNLPPAHPPAPLSLILLRPRRPCTANHPTTGAFPSELSCDFGMGSLLCQGPGSGVIRSKQPSPCGREWKPFQLMLCCISVTMNLTSGVHLTLLQPCKPQGRCFNQKNRLTKTCGIYETPCPHHLSH